MYSRRLAGIEMQTVNGMQWRGSVGDNVLYLLQEKDQEPRIDVVRYGDVVEIINPRYCARILFA